MNIKCIREIDPDIADVILQELDRQKDIQIGRERNETAILTTKINVGASTQDNGELAAITQAGKQSIDERKQGLEEQKETTRAISTDSINARYEIDRMVIAAKANQNLST